MTKLYLLLWLTVSSYLPQSTLLQFCASEGIHVMAHQPLGGRPVSVVNPNADHPEPLLDADVSFHAGRPLLMNIPRRAYSAMIDCGDRCYAPEVTCSSSLIVGSSTRNLGCP